MLLPDTIHVVISPIHLKYVNSQKIEFKGTYVKNKCNSINFVLFDCHCLLLKKQTNIFSLILMHYASVSVLFRSIKQNNVLIFKSIPIKNQRAYYFSFADTNVPWRFPLVIFHFLLISDWSLSMNVWHNDNSKWYLSFTVIATFFTYFLGNCGMLHLTYAKNKFGKIPKNQNLAKFKQYIFSYFLFNERNFCRLFLLFNKAT